MNNIASTNIQDDSHKTVATVVYTLQAISFLLPVAWLFAVILNYVKKNDVTGTWLESHFRWQIRTFWFGLLWCLIGLITLWVGIGILIILIDSIWIIYRIIKGWLNLNDGIEMYVQA